MSNKILLEILAELKTQNELLRKENLKKDQLIENQENIILELINKYESCY